jgi:transcriptional regulator with XRE-family HTH domain
LNDLLERLKKDFQQPEARNTYADSVVNALISAQIKALREDRNLTQEKLAELVGTKQSGISRLQRAEYSAWKIETLRKFARAFGVRLRISFEEFGSLLPDIGGFSEEKLVPRKFEDDPVFRSQSEIALGTMPTYGNKQEPVLRPTQPRKDIGISLVLEGKYRSEKRRRVA